MHPGQDPELGDPEAVDELHHVNPEVVPPDEPEEGGAGLEPILPLQLFIQQLQKARAFYSRILLFNYSNV